MTLATAEASPDKTRKNAVLYVNCPYHKCNWCSVFVKRVGSRDPACKYGHVAIAAAKQAEKRKGRK